MKTNPPPKDVLALSAQIRELETKIETARADIERAGAAAREAERLEGEIQALSDKRARVKAEAFIAGTKADIAELDRQEVELEKASRRAREDGKAGALAVQLLEEKIADAEKEIQDLTPQLKERQREWIAERRRKLLDRYMALFEEMVGIAAKVSAMDVVRNQLSPNPATGGLNWWPGKFMLDWSNGVPVPGDCKVPMPERPDILRLPFEWKATSEQAGIERTQLLAELANAETP